MLTMELSAVSGRLSAYGPRNDKRWIPAFAGMTGIGDEIGAATRRGKSLFISLSPKGENHCWIPAFAGMTEIGDKIGAANRKGKSPLIPLFLRGRSPSPGKDIGKSPLISLSPKGENHHWIPAFAGMTGIGGEIGTATRRGKSPFIPLFLRGRSPSPGKDIGK
ncbi:MAG: hypothetical protein WCO26_17450, partial [Deltaproteobacteria bacterium]